MPLVGFRPTKARLVMENGKESVLVMKVVLDDDDAVELVDGRLAEGPGRRAAHSRAAARTGNGDKSIGSVVYVAESGRETRPAPGQVPGQRRRWRRRNSRRCCASRTRAACPPKFFVDAGERSGPEAKAFGYRMRSGVRVKVWDNHAFRVAAGDRTS